MGGKRSYDIYNIQSYVGQVIRPTAAASVLERVAHLRPVYTCTDINECSFPIKRLTCRARLAEY